MQLPAMGLQRLQSGAHVRAHPCSTHSAQRTGTPGRRQLRVQSIKLPWSWASSSSKHSTEGGDASAPLRASRRSRPATPQWPRQAAMSCVTFASLTGAWGSGGGGSGGGNGNSGGGDGGWHGWGDGGAVPGSGGAPASNVLADVALNEAPDMVEEVILMDVGGMKCGGCVGHVKKVLEEQGDVREASVNLATETALVRVLVPKGSQPQDMKALGDKLAQVVSAAGFKVALQR